MHSTLSEEIISSICKGNHSDPFSVLGLHKIDDGKSSKLVLRVFRPDAKSIAVVIGSKKTELKRISEDGFFEQVFSRRKNPFNYKLAIIPHKGEAFDTE